MPNQQRSHLRVEIPQKVRLPQITTRAYACMAGCTLRKLTLDLHFRQVPAFKLWCVIILISPLPFCQSPKQNSNTRVSVCPVRVRLLSSCCYFVVVCCCCCFPMSSVLLQQALVISKQVRLPRLEKSTQMQLLI